MLSSVLVENARHSDKLLGPRRAPRPVVGVQEFTVRDGERRVDFRTVVHRLALGRRHLDPDDPNAYRLPSGSVVSVSGLSVWRQAFEVCDLPSSAEHAAAIIGRVPKSGSSIPSPDEAVQMTVGLDRSWFMTVNVRTVETAT